MPMPYHLEETEMNLNSRLIAFGVVLSLFAFLWFFTSIDATGESRPSVPAPDFPQDDQPTILDLVAADEHATPPARGLTGNRNARIRVHIKSVTGGKLVPLTNKAPAGPEKSITDTEMAGTSNKVFEVPLSLVEGKQQVVVAWKPNKGVGEGQSAFQARHKTSAPFEIILDTTGPKLEGVELLDVPNAGSTLFVKFQQGDFDESTVTKANFVVTK